MAIIADRVLEGAYQVEIRWYVVGSQRYPADENEYFSTYYEQLEPGQEFVLADPAFNLAEINEDVTDIEYVIRDFCHIQSLIPQNTGITYFQSGRADINNFITADANEDDTTIEVDDVSMIMVGIPIQIGPLQWDVRNITDITGNTVTLDTPLDRGYASGTAVSTSSNLMNYPDGDPAATIARIYDTDGATLAAAVVVQHPLFFDESETVKRYYYSAVLERPFNGARGFGESVNGTVVHNGETIFGGWWAMGENDNMAAERAELITADGTVIAVRDGDYPFEVMLSYSATGESSACVQTETERYFGNHSLFENDGFTDFLREDGTVPAIGYYAGLEQGSMPPQRHVKYWDGFAFLPGIVTGGGLSASCPLAVTNNIAATIYSTEQDIACGTGGTNITLYWEGTAFETGGVTEIYTDQYGPASDFPSTLSTTYIEAGGSQFIWAPPNLTGVSPTCAENFCQDPTAANTGLALPCVYAGAYCDLPNASNFGLNTEGMPAGTYDQPNSLVCVFNAYTATLELDDSNITGTGYNFITSPQSGDNGDIVTLTGELTLQGGHEWVVGPPTPFSEDITLSADVTRTWTPTADVQAVAVAEVGCNTSTAVNYVAGSSGSGECFFSIGNFYPSTSDLGACVTAALDSASTVELVSSNEDDRIRIWDGTQTIGGADGWYSDGTTSFNYQNGNLITSGSCAQPGLNGITVNRVSTGAAVGAEFSATFRIQGSQLSPGTVIIVQAQAEDNVSLNHLPQAFTVGDGDANGFTASVEINPFVTDITAPSYSIRLYAYPQTNILNTVTTVHEIQISDTL